MECSDLRCFYNLGWLSQFPSAPGPGFRHHIFGDVRHFVTAYWLGISAFQLPVRHWLAMMETLASKARLLGNVRLLSESFHEIFAELCLCHLLVQALLCSGSKDSKALQGVLSFSLMVTGYLTEHSLVRWEDWMCRSTLTWSCLRWHPDSSVCLLKSIPAWIPRGLILY